MAPVDDYPAYLAENYDTAVANGETTYAQIARQAAEGGDPHTARWAADRATAAELRKVELTKKKAEQEALDNLNAGTPPATVTGIDPATPQVIADAVTEASNAEVQRTTDQAKPGSKR